MARRVGIAAVAQTKFEGKILDRHMAEMMYDVSRDVMGQTDLKFEEGGIDSTVAASFDLLAGPSGAYMFLGHVVGAYKREDERVLSDGALAVYYGTLQILSGHVDTVLLVSYCKESSVDKNLFEWCGLDQVYQRRVGLDFVSAAGLQAMRYTTKNGITPEQTARVAVKARKNAANNPYAMCRDSLTVDDVLRSEMLCDPIRVHEAKPTPVDPGDGSVVRANQGCMSCEQRPAVDSRMWVPRRGTSTGVNSWPQREVK